MEKENLIQALSDVRKAWEATIAELGSDGLEQSGATGDIGILLMGFMAGLALGALATDRWFAARARRPPLWYGCLLIAGFALFCLVIGAGIRYGSITGLAEIAGLLLITGFLVAAAFAYASLEGASDQREVVAPLYAADLIGGCLGSLACSLLLLPVAGLVVTAVAMAPLVLLAALLLTPHGIA